MNKILDLAYKLSSKRLGITKHCKCSMFNCSEENYRHSAAILCGTPYCFKCTCLWNKQLPSKFRIV